jgi:acyl-CoA reductase-like NAD-dependent aldehyde dehydrogenase
VSDLTPVPIAGEAVTTGEVVEVRAPYDGALVGRVPSCGAGEVDRAVAAAAERHREGPPPAWRRAEILDRAAALLAGPDRHEEFARRIAREAAKPIRTARVEVDRAVSTFQFAAVEARSLAGEVLPLDASPAGEGRLGFTLRVPRGVVAAITPFNFPLNLVAHKLAPAIAAGCPVVLKPASQTPLTAIALADLLLGEAGLPAGWLNVVTGGGRAVGTPLATHPDVAVVTFTGSAEVGWGIRERAPRKHVNLELGNNSPVILAADADWEPAIPRIVATGITHAGQSCISVQRVLVHASLAEAVEAALVAELGEVTVGDPLHDATDMSALIDGDARDRVAARIEEAAAQGARVAAGGAVVDGILQPTLLTGVTGDMKVCRDEVFGPVLAMQSFTDLDEALALANDTRYGLHAGIYTRDLATALAAARTLDFGGVIVNDVPTWRADQMPYGGLRDSGNTREGPAYAVREFTEIRTVVIAG